MQRLVFSWLAMMFLSNLFGCDGNSDDIETVTSSPPDAAEILALDKDADIFQLNGLVYQTNIDWVDELELTAREEIGEILKASPNNSGSNFTDGMATKLPIGSKIYATNERNDAFIVMHKGKLIHYLAASEG